MKLAFVAGEPSGDRAIASVLRALGRTQQVEAFGIGGDAIEACGSPRIRLVAHVRDVSGMGLFELVPRAPAIARALFAIDRAVARERPDVVILASWSTANARLGARFRSRGARVVWISPPEVWAWRARRLPRLARSADRFAVTLPFEPPIWRSAGADARYVGHPALDAPVGAREAIRADLGLDLRARAIAILPGSRPAEIERLLPAFLEAFRIVARGERSLEGRVLMAPSLDERARARVRSLAGRAGVPVAFAREASAASLLSGFDAALVASGTASLEAALCGAPPIIGYRLHPLTMAIAKRLVRTQHIALPNVVLARAGKQAAFIELVQEAMTPSALAEAIVRTLDSDAMRAACLEVRAAMRAPLGDAATFGERVAAMVEALGQADR